jgi:hypothetical protein
MEYGYIILVGKPEGILRRKREDKFKMGLRHGVRVRTELRWFGIGTTGGLL